MTILTTRKDLQNQFTDDQIQKSTNISNETPVHKSSEKFKLK